MRTRQAGVSFSTEAGENGGGRDAVCLLSHRYTLIPTSIVLGLGAAPLWSAQCTYLTIMGNAQAEKVGKVGRDVVNQYFGIFFLIFQSSGVWGNLISSLVFGQTPTQGKRSWGSVMAPECPPILLTRVFIPRQGRVHHPAWVSTPGPQPLLCPALLQDSLCSSGGRSCPQVLQPCWPCPPGGRGNAHRTVPRGNGGHGPWNLGSQSRHRPFRPRTGSTDLLSH